MKTIEQAISAASKCLQEVGIENPRLESEFLIAACLQMPRAYLILNRHQTLADQKIRTLRTWLKERQKRKPLAYVTKEQPFRDLNLRVTPSVLVPRPETELLVEQALRLLDAFETRVTAVDVGTGSGNIALSLAKHAKVKRVIGIDRSAAALRVARSNEKHLKGGAPIQWMEGDLLTPLKKRMIRAELIVANLPYVRSREMLKLEPELHWEPPLALDGGRDGLRLIEPCIQQAVEILEPRGMLLLEIGAHQSKAVRTLLAKNPVWTDVRVFRDFAGLPRIVQAQKKGQ